MHLIIQVFASPKQPERCPSLGPQYYNIMAVRLLGFAGEEVTQSNIFVNCIVTPSKTYLYLREVSPLHFIPAYITKISRKAEKPTLSSP